MVLSTSTVATITSTGTQIAVSPTTTATQYSTTSAALSSFAPPLFVYVGGQYYLRQGTAYTPVTFNKPISVISSALPPVTATNPASAPTVNYTITTASGTPVTQTTAIPYGANVYIYSLMPSTSTGQTYIKVGSVYYMKSGGQYIPILPGNYFNTLPGTTTAPTTSTVTVKPTTTLPQSTYTAPTTSTSTKTSTTSTGGYVPLSVKEPSYSTAVQPTYTPNISTYTAPNVIIPKVTYTPPSTSTGGYVSISVKEPAYSTAVQPTYTPPKPATTTVIPIAPTNIISTKQALNIPLAPTEQYIVKTAPTIIPTTTTPKIIETKPTYIPPSPTPTNIIDTKQALNIPLSPVEKTITNAVRTATIIQQQTYGGTTATPLTNTTGTGITFGRLPDGTITMNVTQEGLKTFYTTESYTTGGKNITWNDKMLYTLPNFIQDKTGNYTVKGTVTFTKSNTIETQAWENAYNAYSIAGGYTGSGKTGATFTPSTAGFDPFDPIVKYIRENTGLYKYLDENPLANDVFTTAGTAVLYKTVKVGGIDIVTPFGALREPGDALLSFLKTLSFPTAKGAQTSPLITTSVEKTAYVYPKSIQNMFTIMDAYKQKQAEISALKPVPTGLQYLTSEMSRINYGIPLGYTPPAPKEYIVSSGDYQKTIGGPIYNIGSPFVYVPPDLSKPIVETKTFTRENVAEIFAMPETAERNKMIDDIMHGYTYTQTKTTYEGGGTYLNPDYVPHGFHKDIITGTTMANYEIKPTPKPREISNIWSETYVGIQAAINPTKKEEQGTTLPFDDKQYTSFSSLSTPEKYVKILSAGMHNPVDFFGETPKFVYSSLTGDRAKSQEGYWRNFLGQEIGIQQNIKTPMERLGYVFESPYIMATTFAGGTYAGGYIKGLSGATGTGTRIVTGVERALGGYFTTEMTKGGITAYQQGTLPSYLYKTGLLVGLTAGLGAGLSKEGELLGFRKYELSKVTTPEAKAQLQTQFKAMDTAKTLSSEGAKVFDPATVIGKEQGIRFTEAMMDIKQQGIKISLGGSGGQLTYLDSMTRGLPKDIDIHVAESLKIQSPITFTEGGYKVKNVTPLDSIRPEEIKLAENEFYHGTKIENVSSILKEGIQPKPELMRFPLENPTIKPDVLSWLTKDYAHALSYAEGNPKSVFRVELTSKQMKNVDFGTGGGFAVSLKESISPNQIRLVSRPTVPKAVYPDIIPEGIRSDWSGRLIDTTMRKGEIFHHTTYPDQGVWLTKAEHWTWHEMAEGKTPIEPVFFEKYKITNPEWYAAKGIEITKGTGGLQFQKPIFGLTSPIKKIPSYYKTEIIEPVRYDVARKMFITEKPSELIIEQKGGWILQKPGFAYVDNVRQVEATFKEHGVNLSNIDIHTMARAGQELATRGVGFVEKPIRTPAGSVFDYQMRLSEQALRKIKETYAPEHPLRGKDWVDTLDILNQKLGEQPVEMKPSSYAQMLQRQGLVDLYIGTSSKQIYDIGQNPSLLFPDLVSRWRIKDAEVIREQQWKLTQLQTNKDLALNEFYHGTTKQDIVMKYGLDPKQAIDVPESTFLTKSYEIAKTYAGDTGKVFKVSLTDIQLKNLDIWTPGGKAFILREKIAPSQLSLYDSTKIKSSLKGTINEAIGLTLTPEPTGAFTPKIIIKSFLSPELKQTTYAHELLHLEPYLRTGQVGSEGYAYAKESTAKFYKPTLADTLSKYQPELREGTYEMIGPSYYQLHPLEAPKSEFTLFEQFIRKYGEPIITTDLYSKLPSSFKNQAEWMATEPFRPQFIKQGKISDAIFTRGDREFLFKSDWAKGATFFSSMMTTGGTPTKYDYLLPALGAGVIRVNYPSTLQTAYTPTQYSLKPSIYTAGKTTSISTFIAGGTTQYTPSDYTSMLRMQAYPPSVPSSFYTTPSYTTESKTPYIPSYSPPSRGITYSDYVPSLPSKYTPSAPYTPSTYTPTYTPPTYTPSPYTPSYKPPTYTPPYKPPTYTPPYSPPSYPPYTPPYKLPPYTPPSILPPSTSPPTTPSPPTLPSTWPPYTPPTTPPPTTRLFIPIELTPSKEKKHEPGYDVYVKDRTYVHGKQKYHERWKKANPVPLSEGEALSLGATAVDQSAAASFKVTQAEGKPQKLKIAADPWFMISDKFYKKKGTYIETTENRIDSAGEIKGISALGWIANQQKLYTTQSTYKTPSYTTPSMRTTMPSMKSLRLDYNAPGTTTMLKTSYTPPDLRKMMKGLGM